MYDLESPALYPLIEAVTLAAVASNEYLAGTITRECGLYFKTYTSMETKRHALKLICEKMY